MHRAITVSLALLAPAALLCGCGDDEAASPTSEDFCAELAAQPQDEGPFADFFEQHPEPTLEDWAEGLPAIIEELHAGAERAAAIVPSDELAGEFDAFLDALATIEQNLRDASAAASAGDQAEFDRLETVNQDENVPAMEAAMGSLQSACEVLADEPA